MKEKVKLSSKIWPIYYGLSEDLMFWAAINTLFLTRVKHLDAGQINLIMSLSVIVCFFGYFLINKIIGKIGALKSIKIGNILLLVASLLFTFLKSFNGILFGFIVYQIAFLFKSMDHIIIRKNLKYLGREDEFFSYVSKGTFIYSFITMLIALISGFIFNLNNYLPMYIAIFCAFINVILMNFLTCDNDAKEASVYKVKINKIIIFVLIFYGLIYSSIEVAQTNTKLIMQFNMEEFLSNNKTVLYFSFILFLSRLFRVIGNLLFLKIFKILKDKMSIILNVSLLISLLLILFGDLYRHGFVGIILVALGFVILLLLRDPTQNYSKTLLLNRSPEKHHKKLSMYFFLARKLVNFTFNLIVSLILLKLDLKYAIMFLIIIVTFTLYISISITKMVEEKSN